MIEHHPDALEHDWQTRFGRSIYDLREVGWPRAWWWTKQILHDPYSHTNSALRGDKYLPHPAEVAAIDHLEGSLNSKRGKNTVPIKLPRPWEGRPPRYGLSEEFELSPAQQADRDARRKAREAMGAI